MKMNMIIINIGIINHEDCKVVNIQELWICIN